MDENNKNEIIDNEEITSDGEEITAESDDAVENIAEDNDQTVCAEDSPDTGTDEQEERAGGDDDEQAPDAAPSGVKEPAAPEVYSAVSSDEDAPENRAAAPDPDDGNQPEPVSDDTAGDDGAGDDAGDEAAAYLEETLLGGNELNRDEEELTAVPRMPVKYYVITGFVLAGLFLAVLVIIFAVKGTLTPFIGRADAFIRRGSISDFSAHITGSSVREIGVYKNNILVLSDTALVGFSSAGKEKLVHAVSCDEPSVAVKRNSVLLFDRSGTSFTLIKGKQVAYTGAAPKSILDADTGSNGRFCIAMRDDEYKCSVMVFDPSVYSEKSEEPAADRAAAPADVNLTYWFSDGYVADVICDDSCRYIGVSLIRSDDAVVNSEFYLVDTNVNDTTAYPVFKLPGEVIAGAAVLDDGQYFIVTDTAAYRTNGGELEKVVNFENDLQLEFTSLSYDVPPAILLSSYGLKDSGVLMFFDKDGYPENTVNVSGRAIGFDASKHGAAVMLPDRILTYTSRGLLAGETALDSACENIVFDGNYIYLQFVGEMKKIGAYKKPVEG